MSVKLPPKYGPRITVMTLVLGVILGLGFNIDGILGPVPEPIEAPEPPAEQNAGMDFDMENSFAKVVLEKATTSLLTEVSSDLPPLPPEWSRENLKRDQGYVEDDDEDDYYDELDQLNTVMKVANNKEREALAKLFEKDDKTPDTKASARDAEPETKTLTIRPNAAVIKKKTPSSRASTRSRSKKPTSQPHKAKPATKDAPVAQETAEAPPEPETPEPAIDRNASAKDLIAQGRKLLLSGNPTAAEKVYRLALTKSPGSARARYGLAKALYQKSRATEAMAELRRILSANKNHGAALLMMGSLLQEQGQAGQAKTYYQRYLDARPNGRRANEIRSILGRL